MRATMPSTVLLSLLLSSVCGCGSSAPPTVTDTPEPTSTPSDDPTTTPADDDTPAPRQISFAVVKDTANVDLAALGAPAFELLVIEPSRDGSLATELTPSEVDTLRTAGGCPRQVIAYLNIAEAQDTRAYWDPRWVSGDGVTGFPLPGLAPDWLGEWDYMLPATYQVRYWDPDWQALIMGGETAALDRIIDSGYDGVMLDGIDAFEYWSTSALRELSRTAARDHMVTWVAALTEYARQVRGIEDFAVYVEGGAAIALDDADAVDAVGEVFLGTIDGLAVEHVFYNRDVPKLNAQVEDALATLAHYTSRGLPVLVIDYVMKTPLQPAQSDGLVADLYADATAAGLSPYAAPADEVLDDVLTLTPDTWSVAQPPPCGQ